MTTSLLKGLAEERVMVLKTKDAKLHLPLRGILRLVDSAGKTLGIILAKETLDEIEEDLEAANPEFLASLKESLGSGRVSGTEVKKKAGLL